MFFGSQRYPEGQFQPQCGGGHNWHAWCATGVLQVLQSGEYAEYLAMHPDRGYTINLANASAVCIQPGHPLWEKLAEIAKDYSVEVFQLTLEGGYLPWTGAAGDSHTFDCIRINPGIAQKIS